jgi:hypothetical protein
MYPDSTIVFTPPDDSGYSWAAWHATTFTSHTTSGDVWNGQFRLRDANGNTITWVYMASPRMTSTYTAYTWDFYQPILLSAQDLSRTVLVDWSGTC